MSDSADGPNVSTQGPKDQVHGVGGTSESQVKQEGIDHIKKEIGLSSTTGAASAGGAQLPSTNRGSDDAAGGDLGDDDPQQHQTTGGGLVETVKGYLGFGGAGDEQSRGDDVVVNDLTGASDDPATKPHHAAAGTATATGTKASMMASNNAGESKPNEGNSQPAAEQQQDAPRGDDHKGDSKEEGENSKEEKKPGKVMENKDAIPTAGGEKLGEKHWGESKIVRSTLALRSRSAVLSVLLTVVFFWLRISDP